MCRRRGAIVASVPTDGLRILRGEDHLALYQFNTGTAKHFFCPTCGIYTHHQRRSNPSQYSFNVGCLEGVDPFEIREVTVYDGVNHPRDGVGGGSPLSKRMRQPIPGPLGRRGRMAGLRGSTTRRRPMFRSYGVLLSALTFASLLSAVDAQADGVREAVEAGNRAFVAAFLRGDSAAIASLYTEDAQVIAPGSPVATGRTAIAGFWQTFIDSGIKDVALETREVESEVDLAYESGTVRLTGKDSAVTEARYIVVWKRIDDRWMLHRDIWNSE
jgi:uncharacterized protein (TIGR02246 family)